MSSFRSFFSVLLVAAACVALPVVFVAGACSLSIDAPTPEPAPSACECDVETSGDLGSTTAPADVPTATTSTSEPPTATTGLGPDDMIPAIESTDTPSIPASGVVRF